MFSNRFIRSIAPATLMLVLSGTGCSENIRSRPGQPAMEQTILKNAAARTHPFLADMYADAYFPKQVVDKGAAILVRLCHRIETEQPNDLAALYALTHAATNEFNELQADFAANGSELETGARESIGMDFAFIAKAYGFDADVEELIATREW